MTNVINFEDYQEKKLQEEQGVWCPLYRAIEEFPEFPKWFDGNILIKDNRSEEPIFVIPNEDKIRDYLFQKNIVYLAFWENMGYNTI